MQVNVLSGIFSNLVGRGHMNVNHCIPRLFSCYIDLSARDIDMLKVSVFPEAIKRKEKWEISLFSKWLGCWKSEKIPKEA